MTHLDPETLALLALGEDAAAPEQRWHLSGCDACAAEVRRFARPVAASRSGAVPLTAPGPHVWAGIAGTLGLAETGDPLVSARRPRRLVLPLAAAAVLVVAAGVIAALLALQPQRVAAADLSAFPGWPGASGTAVLQRLPDGRSVVEVRTTARAPGRDREVWLMTAGARRLVSLGLLRGTTGTFAVPTGVDLTRFDVVDVSAEPRDGNPAHSGDSIVRGELRS